MSGRFFLAMELARAYELRGQEGEGIRLLEAADLGPFPLYEFDVYTDAAMWHRLRFERARLLRKTGRVRDAGDIETELRRELRLADPDHPLVVRLNEKERRPLDVY